MQTLTRRSVLAALGATTAVTALRPAFAQASSVRIGTSSVGSVFYTLAVGLGELLRDQAGINTTVEPVGGSAANVNGIANDNVDLAVTNSFAAFSGYNGRFGFPQPVDIRLVVQGQPSYRWIFVREGAGIETPKDLEGKTIIGERRSLPELRLLMDAVIQHFGLDEGAINIVGTTESNESIDAIRTGSVDAIIMPFSPRAGQIEEPMRDGAMRMLTISAEDRDALLELLPNAFYGVDQPADDFSNQAETVPLVSLNTYLVASPELDAETVYQTASTVFENNEAFVGYHPVARNWTVDNTLVSPAIPFHEGLVRYLEENGYWSEELAARQEELLAR